MDYEKLLNEKEILMNVWGKECIVAMDDDIEFPQKFIVEKLNWVEEHKDNIIQFALDAEDFLDGINEFIAKEIARKGSSELYDGTILKEVIDEERLKESILINSIYFSENDFGIDLATAEPDYFGGHLLAISVRYDSNEMEYEGMNG